MENFISKNILYLVDKMGYGQDEFGAMFDLKRGNINSYINTGTLPKIDTIQKICKHFQITIDSFINDDLSKGYEVNPEKSKTLAEPQPGGIYGDKDKIIAAQAETIETQKKHIATLDKLVETLEEKLSQAS